MNLILDTHVVLWWLDDPALIAEPANNVYVSAASAWEIAIKRGLGKLAAPSDFESAIDACGFRALPVTVAHALATERLPFHHRDPFDRLLVAQAQLEGAIVVTRDPVLSHYGVPVIAG
jgi:PIN domain nuclease of toxin-antitoxin system